MACLGLGIDMVGVERFSRIVGRGGGRLLDRLFTPDERRYCERKASRLESYSARFAAKEAFFKAIGHGVRGGIGWHDVEVSNDRLGKPSLKITGRAREIVDSLGVRRHLLGISHSDGYTVAVVILEG